MRRNPTMSACMFALVALFFSGGLAACGSAGSPAVVTGAAGSILGWSPGVTRDLPLGAPFVVYFSRGMNRSSVQRSWHLAPPMTGRFSWNADTLSFQPARPLATGALYRLSVGRGARDDQGKPLQNPLSVAFSTGVKLAVTGVSPAAGTAGVPSSTLISVTFNHPMIALAGLGVPTPDPRGWHVSLSPATAGHGSWLGTSTWVFHPASGLVPSGAYTVAVAAGLRDAWGDRLTRSFRWSFSTETPEVVGEKPAGGARLADPSGRIAVTFNQPMATGTTARAFSLDSGGPVSGSISWTGNTLEFTPSSPLDFTKTYRVTMASGATAANGRATLGRTVSWSFTVARPPSVASSVPAQGGTVSGGIQLNFTAPMDRTSLDRHLTVTPPIPGMETGLFGSKYPADNDVYSIYGNLQPSTSYTLTLSAGARDQFGRVTPAAFSLRFSSAPLYPSAVLYGMSGFGAVSFTAGRVVRAPVQFVNVSHARFVLVRTTVAAANGSSGYGGPLSPPSGTTVRTWGMTLPSALNRVQNASVPAAQPDGSPLAPGVYWLGVEGTSTASATDTPPSSSEVVVAANASLTMKSGMNRTIVWAVSSRSGQPLQGVSIRLLNSDNKVVGVSRTDSSGVATFTAAFGSVGAAYLDDNVHFGMASVGWQPPSQNFTESGSGPYRGPQNGTYMYTDRPIYRTGQTVYFRAVLWRDRDAVYSLYRPRRVGITAMGGSGHRVYQGYATLDRFGTVHGHFSLPAGVATGYAQIVATIEGTQVSAFTSFVISEYRKPEFLTAVTANRARYAQGDTIRARVHVGYVFGAPAPDMQMSWTAYTEDRYTPPSGWESYDFGDQDAIQQQAMIPQNAGLPGGAFGVEIASGAGVTDAAGNMTVSLPVDLKQKLVDQTVTIEATATDINHQSVSGRVQVEASTSMLEIGILPQAQVVPVGGRETVNVAALNSAGHTLPSETLTAKVYLRTYTSELTTSIQGQTYWRQVPHDALQETRPLTTNAHGMATVSFTPQKGGDYHIEITGTDSSGRVSQSGLSIYASSAGFSEIGFGSDTSLSVSLDRSSYRVGDVARLFIGAPFAHGTVLLTIERSDVRSHRVLPLTSSTSVVRIPVEAGDLPNVYITVTAFRGMRNGSLPDWRYGLAVLHVRLDPKRVVVHLAQNRSHYHPGDPVTYTVTTTDASGKPVTAQVSLALVDTAVLALADESFPDILQALYADRYDAVQTASEGAISIDRLSGGPNGQIRPGGFGGGGGGPGQAPNYLARPSSGKVRHHFADTAYWTATLVTQGGKARVHVTLPDNLTTWRLDARAVTPDLRAGGTTLETLSTQDVIVRPVTPRFLFQGDSVRVGAIVNNNLGTPITATVSLQTRGLSLAATATQRVRIPARGERLVSWHATVPLSSAASLTFVALTPGGVRGDAVRVSIPVHPPLTGETVAAAGQVYGSAGQYVVLPRSAVAHPGALTVQVQSSLVAGLGTAYQTFAPTSFDSVDDIAQRVLAASALRQLPPAVSGLSTRERARLPAQLNRDVAGLERTQLSDGGWPWFAGPGARSDRGVSEDVFDALLSAGGGVSRATLTRGESYLSQALGHVTASERARILSLLSRAAVKVGSRASALYDDAVQRATLDPGALADLAVSLNRSGATASVKAILATLDSTAAVSATGAHWENLTDGFAISPVAVTSRVVPALLQLSPSDPLLPAAVRWLALSRQGLAWDTRADSARAINALSGFARATREGTGQLRFTVLLDRQSRLQGRLVPRRRQMASQLSVPVSQLNRRSSSSLVIRRGAVNGTAAPGPLYYVAQLQYYRPAASIVPENQGVSVTRRYEMLNGTAVTSVPAGTLIRVVLTIQCSRALEHADVEDPVPSGLEPLDASLKTTRQGLFGSASPLPAGQLDLFPYVGHTDLRDDRVSLFVPSLPQGTYRYMYVAQATDAGTYGVAPTHVSEVFFPEVFGRSAGQQFRITQ